MDSVTPSAIALDDTPPAPASQPCTRLNLPVEGLSCAACVGRVERALRAVPEVGDVSVNLATRRASLSLPVGTPAHRAVEAIRAAGYTVPETTTTVGVEGLSCAACVGRVERVLARLPGVSAASVNLATGRAELRHSDGAVCVGDIERAVREAGYEPRQLTDPAAPSGEAGRDRQARALRALTRDMLLAVLLAAPVVLLDMGGHLVSLTLGGPHGAFVQAALATLVLAGPGRRFFRHGLVNLLRGRPDMNSLVALGAGAAYLFSLVSTFAPGLLPPGGAHLYYEASGLIVALILLGRTLEARARGRTGAAVERLLDLAPRTAHALRDGGEVDIPLSTVRIGDVLRVRPGERVPADGRVIAGTSYVDESPVTGEPVPVRKSEGAATVGGTLNTRGSFDLRVERVGSDTLLAQIARLVEEAQGGKLPIQALVDRVTGWFVPAVMAVSAATFLTWLVLAPEPALGPALVAAVSVLIIACPCAMGLATPVSIMVGTGRAAARGVLFRRGSALQALSGVRVVALDKTGTLTQGRPALTDFVGTGGLARGTVLRLAGAVEARSEHPIARTIVEAARAEAGALPAVEAFEARPGYGVTGRVDGQVVALGARRFMAGLGVATAALDDEAERLAAQGRSPLFVALDGRLAALLAVADPVKPDAAAALGALRARGLRLAMITGDDRCAAEAVARALSIDTVVAEVTPADKVAAVKRLRAQHGPVAFVGDGINDAPALAEAEVGLAIGTGTDVAVESADVVLMSGALHGLIEATNVACATMANIRQNLFWAFAYNVALIPVAAGALALFGGPTLSPVLAAGAMALSSVFVVGNALRLRRGAPRAAVPA